MLTIIDYKAGNLTSVKLAVEHVGGECAVTRDPAVVAKAERVIFPGVGQAATCMENLRRLGLDRALLGALKAGRPVLAICVGMQRVFEASDEGADAFGPVSCLGVLPGAVRKFAFPPEPRVKVPHMGWNAVEPTRDHPLFEGVPAHSEFYFVHSYYVEAGRESDVLARTEYGGKVFASMAARDNLAACQFHPEKSGDAGLTMLRNFLSWRPGGRIDAQ
ncbi:MAG: imidazole glycerol phosphate synthase subunit HisH [Planctomycetes bacterium]|nr:imidazole glycerol phosphate synthase subunit HisH [Planctomycetota bacterium]